MVVTVRDEMFDQHNLEEIGCSKNNVIEIKKCFISKSIYQTDLVYSNSSRNFVVRNKIKMGGVNDFPKRNQSLS